jgi:signal transduction histidine kinase/CheY-like chemotaxis protein/AraC-like DNA-binding protein/streptogramin lyase
MAQDTTGLLWFRSGPSFYIYDGHELSKVGPDALGIPLLDIGSTKFYGDKTQPYFYIPGDSLIVYDPAAREIVRVIDPIPEKLGAWPKPQVINYVGVSEDGALWGLAHKENFEDALVVRWNGSGAFRTVDTIDLSWYYDKTLVRGNHFFVKKRDQVVEFDSLGRVKTYHFPAGADPVMPSMVKDAENTIWVLYSPDISKNQYGVYYLKEGQDEFIRLPRDQRFPQEEKKGQLFADGHFIWHWGDPFSLSRMRITDGAFEDFTDAIIEQSVHFPFYKSTLLNLFRDRSGVVWMTTRAGIVKMTIEEDLFRIYGLEEISPDCADDGCHVRGIAEDEAGHIYLSHHHGIAVLDPKTGSLRALPLDIPPQKQNLHGLSYARGTLFWNEYAIDLKTFGARKIFSPSNYTYLTHGTDPERNHLWIGVNGPPLALYQYDLQTRALRTIHLPDTVLNNLNSEIRQIHVSSSTGAVFLSVWAEGLLELGVDGEIHHLYRSYPMYGLHEDEAARLWIGQGQESGLSRLDLHTGKITESPYLMHSFGGSIKRAFHVLPGKDGYLWLVTERGTMRLDKESGELTRFPMFPTFSDVAFQLPPGYAAKDGALYIGTPDGRLKAFDPGMLYKKAGFDRRYPVVIKRFERFNQKRDTLLTQLKNLIQLSEIHLTHRDRYFQLEFFVPDFRNTRQNFYSHWLEGYDKEWSAPSRINQLRYENLPPGEYTLHIRGGLTPDYFESSERIIKVTVAPAWYETWWAYSLFTLIVAGLLYRFYHYQVGRQMEKAEARRLRELDALKSRLFTNITHEFRTPLTVIMGMAGKIRGHSEEKTLIQRNSESLLRLINQLLDLSKLDSGTIKMDKIQADIVTYLQYLTESFYSMASEKNIRLVFDPEIRELIMDYDEEKIQHIIYNLLTNAIKFTPDGGKVVLHLQPLERNGRDWLQITVRDTGIGISAENLPKIFDRFYQGDASSTRREAGAGIGLALTKELIEMMGGKITVESKLGVGTDFQVHLPVKREVDTSRRAQEGPRVSSSTGGGSALHPPGESSVPSLALSTFQKDAETPALLIIEDNRDVITYIESLLIRDYHIEIARNGQEGIDKALEMAPDIIISDVMMPEKDGYEVCETLKNDERTSHIPIILLTAKASVDDRIEGLKGGADAYLIKPFHKEELFVLLEKLIALRKALQARYGSPGLFSKQLSSGKEPSLDERFLQKLIKVVQNRLNDPEFGVIDLCGTAHLSNTQVNRKLKALTGTPSQFIRSIRLQKALELLQNTDLNISEIAYEVGFNDPSYFSRSFFEEFGHPPKEVRK